MRDTGGFLLLYRCLIESPVFASPELLKVWIWCLCRASHKKRNVPVSTGRGDSVVTLLPGEFLFGRKAAAKELNMPETTVRDRMAKLQRIGCISLKPATHYTVVSIVKWRDYQPPVGEPPANQPPTNRQPTATNNKGKKGNNGEKGLNDHKSFLVNGRVGKRSGARASGTKQIDESTIGEASHLVNRITTLVPPPDDAARLTIARAAVLVACGTIAQHAVIDALEATRNTSEPVGRPYGYLLAMIRKNCDRKGMDFDAAAEQIKLTQADLAAIYRRDGPDDDPDDDP